MRTCTTAVTRPSAFTVTFATLYWSPYVAAVTPVVVSVGLGYVPASDPPAGPDGGPPSDVPHTTSVPFDSSTVDAAPTARRVSAGVPLAPSTSPRASGVAVANAGPFSFATVRPR